VKEKGWTTHHRNWLEKHEQSNVLKQCGTHLEAKVDPKNEYFRHSTTEYKRQVSLTSTTTNDTRSIVLVMSGYRGSARGD